VALVKYFIFKLITVNSVTVTFSIRIFFLGSPLVLINFYFWNLICNTNVQFQKRENSQKHSINKQLLIAAVDCWILGSSIIFRSRRWLLRPKLKTSTSIFKNSFCVQNVQSWEKFAKIVGKTNFSFPVLPTILSNFFHHIG
jgi:hypothetical protein